MVKTVQPLITIAIPTYQRLNYLQLAVESALAQTYPNIEIVISQDPTPDGLDPDIQTWSQDLASHHPQVVYQANATNLGLAGNWNAATDTARGDYIVIIGDDDRLLPNFVQSSIDAAQPDTQVIFSNHYIIDSQGDRLVADSHRWTQHYQRDRMPSGSLPVAEIWVWQNSIPLLSALIRTKTARRLRFKEDLNNPEIELFLRLAQEGGEFVFVPEYLAEYRTHPQSATSKDGGLRTDRLVNYLLPLEVAPEVAPYKQAFLSGMMVNAVSKCLLSGNKIQAQDWLESEYYPQHQRFWFGKFIQDLCVTLPGHTGVDLYKRLHSFKRLLK